MNASKVAAGLVTFTVESRLGRVRGAATPKGLALVALPNSDWDGPLARLAKIHGKPRGTEKSGYFDLCF